MSPRRLSAAAFTQEKLFEKNIDSPAVRTVASPLPSERFLCPPRRAHVRAAPACRAHRAGHKWMQRRCPLRATYLRTPGLQAQGLTRLVRAATAQPRWHVFPACVCGALARRGGPRALTLPRSRSPASSPCPCAVSQPPWLLRRLLRLSCKVVCDLLRRSLSFEDYGSFFFFLGSNKHLLLQKTRGWQCQPQ